jgi:hypothetical protein
MKKTYPIIKLKWRFFWTECDKCHNYFRFEKMWYVIRVYGWYSSTYFCTECFKNKEEVLAYINLSSESVHSHFLKLDPLNQPKESGVTEIVPIPPVYKTDITNNKMVGEKNYWFDDALGLPHFDFSKTIPFPKIEDYIKKDQDQKSAQIENLIKAFMEQIGLPAEKCAINIKKTEYGEQINVSKLTEQTDSELTPPIIIKRNPCYYCHNFEPTACFYNPTHSRVCVLGLPTKELGEECLHQRYKEND